MVFRWLLPLFIRRSVLQMLALAKPIAKVYVNRMPGFVYVSTSTITVIWCVDGIRTFVGRRGNESWLAEGLWVGTSGGEGLWWLTVVCTVCVRHHGQDNHRIRGSDTDCRAPSHGSILSQIGNLQQVSVVWMPSWRRVLTYQPKPRDSIVGMEASVPNTLPGAEANCHNTEDGEQDGGDQDGLCKACRAHEGGTRRGHRSRCHGWRPVRWRCDRRVQTAAACGIGKEDGISFGCRVMHAKIGDETIFT